MTQVAVSSLAATIGSATIFENVTFTVASGERWGVIGRNGTGKSTLFRTLTGRLTPAKGDVVRDPRSRISLLEQHHDFGDAATVWDAAASGVGEVMALGARLEQLAEAMRHEHDDEALADYAHALERFEHAGGYAAPARVDAVLDGLGFDPMQAKSRPLAALSGGERGRLALVRELLRDADVLLLDEPTNHLDLDTSRWLEQYLLGSGRSIMLVSHDRAFIAALADHILHFEGGTATAYSGGYESFLQQRAERRLSLERQVDKQRRFVAAEEDYIRRNIAGQNSSQAKGRRKRLTRLPRLTPPPAETGVMALRLEASSRGGDLVVVANNVTVAMGDTPLVEDFTAEIRRGDRVALIGPNGTGKSTFLNAIVGGISVRSGELRLGPSTTFAYYRQDLAQLSLEGSPFDIIGALRTSWNRGAIQNHLGRFGFSGDDVQRRISSFSGGERARLALASLVLRDANLLILDEPTNHLDVESIEALEDALEPYDGTVLFVSHDRELLRGLSTRVWSLADRRISVFDGGFAEWEEAGMGRTRTTAPSQPPRQRPVQRTVQKTVSAPRAQSRRDGERASKRAVAAVAVAEQEVAAMEARVNSLTEALADPGLYAKGEGAGRAAALAQELDHARSMLEQAMIRWSAAMEVVSKAESPSARRDSR